MELRGKNILIRFLETSDVDSLLELRKENSDLFQRHSPKFDADYYTLDATVKFIGDSIKQRKEDRNYSFGIFLKENGTLIGDVSLFQMARGPIQKCLIGYSLDQQHNGRGYTTEAVALAVEFAFRELHLHRVEAGAMLDNIGSMRVLEKAGFHKEGIEQKGVKINGQWEDHQIFAILSGND